MSLVGSDMLVAEVMHLHELVGGALPACGVHHAADAPQLVAASPIAHTHIDTVTE